MRKAVKTVLAEGDEISWSAPLGAHPSAVSHVMELNRWIQMTHGGLDPNRFSGHVFLYNISLETLSPRTFQNIWIPNYGGPTNLHGDNFFHSVHILIPWHDTKPQRIAEWIDCRHIFNLVRQLDQPGSWGNDWGVQKVMEKTWVSFVAAPEEKEIPAEDDPVAAYLIALYFALACDPDEGARKANELQLRAALASITDVSEITDDVVDAARVVMGGGIAEPFSTRKNGYYNYNFLLSFAARQEYTPPVPTRCVIRHHIKVLAQLWQDRSALPNPVQDRLGRCAFIERSPELHGERELRLDAFLLWAKHALRLRNRDNKKIWTFPPKVSSAELERDAEASFCCRYPGWETQFARTKITRDILNKGEIRLAPYELFPGTLYCRRAEVHGNLKMNLIDKIGWLLTDQTKLEAKPKGAKKKRRISVPDYSSFFVTGAQGSGKSELIEQLKSHLEQQATQGKLQRYTLTELPHDDPHQIADGLSTAAQAAWRKTSPTIIILDEAQKCANLKKFTNKYYTYFDVRKRIHAPIIGLFLTNQFSGDETRLRPWLESADMKCRKDFARRTTYISLPVWNAEDQILTLGAKILRELEIPTFVIQKKALDFLIVDQPYPSDQLLDRVCDIVRGSHGSDPLRLSHFPGGDRGVEAALKRNRERVSEMAARGRGYPWSGNDCFRFHKE